MKHAIDKRPLFLVADLDHYLAVVAAADYAHIALPVVRLVIRCEIMRAGI